jgi:hypothetical protein
MIFETTCKLNPYKWEFDTSNEISYICVSFPETKIHSSVYAQRPVEA